MSTRTSSSTSFHRRFRSHRSRPRLRRRPSRRLAVRSEPLFALPGIPGSTSFALIGDSGSGDSAQKAVADAMLRYFTTARRFSFVLMLGDNLYHDDYQGEFSVPYQGLLERGVLFYAALGNHDRELQQHYKPFHMTDRLYFAFTEGNARFVVLEQQPSRRRRPARLVRRCVRQHRHEMAHRLLSSPAVFVGRPREGEPRDHPAGARAGARAQSRRRRVQRSRSPVRAGRAPAGDPVLRVRRRRQESVRLPPERVRRSRIVGAPFHGRGNRRGPDVLRGHHAAGADARLRRHLADRGRGGETPGQPSPSRGRTGAAPRRRGGASRLWSANADSACGGVDSRSGRGYLQEPAIVFMCFTPR